MSLTPEQRLEAYHLMRTIRRFEERCAELYSAGDIGGFLHLYIGQEALAAAVKYATRPDDNVITAYRDHGIALAKGLEAGRLMAEMLGRTTGVSKGRGGSMHLADVEKRMWGGWAIVGGHLPLATGLALADDYNGDDRVTICLMGDGSTNIGYFHEALNMAGVWKLPVVWIIENNEYGMGTSVKRASAVEELTEKARAYNMPAKRIDGNDLQGMVQEIGEAVEHVRDPENGPVLFEAVTYRFRGHSMGDPERYRTKEEITEAQRRDPIFLWAEKLIEDGVATQEALDHIGTQVEEEVAAAVKFAKESPLPELEDLYDHVYAD
ncbi:MAG: pyruvate dehydrogenase (acetyl-transferring) E1 component subunit alpha [Chloroflexi bacterium]|nr:pyruvate dehydrogenase (acetyl-transferring) E1 component subunit alpha [Chloroflexota bacterium]